MEFSYDDGVDNFGVSTTLTATFDGTPEIEYTSTDEGDAYRFAGWRFTPDLATVKYDGRFTGRVNSCQYGAVDVPFQEPPATFDPGPFDVWMPINGETGTIYNIYTGIGLGLQYSIRCTDGTTKVFPAPNSFNFTSRLTQATLQTIDPNMTLMGTNFAAPVDDVGTYTPPAPVMDAVYNW